MALILVVCALAAGGTGCAHDQASSQESPSAASSPALKSASAAPTAAARADDTPVAAAGSPATKSAAELSLSDPPSAAAHTAASRFLATIFRGTRHEAYEALHSKVRAISSEAEFAESLDLMDAAYGKVLMAELKQEFVGAQQSTKLGTQNIRKLTYAVSTTKYPKGTHFAIVVVATDGDHVAPETYQVITFMGEIPPDLR
jgi:hypothetical protein